MNDNLFPNTCEVLSTNIKKRLTCANKRDRHLLIIQIGDDKASNAYIKGKVNDCEQVGLPVTYYKHDWNVSTNTICSVINTFTSMFKGGVIIQLPIPKHINLDDVLACIPPEYDVDGMRKDSPYTPCTPKGIMSFIKYNSHIDLDGANVTIIGRSEIVGKPLAKLMLDKNATVTVCHSKTKDIKQHTINADIIVCAVGKRNLLTSDMIKEGCVVIDVGINRDDNNKLCGDVDYNGCYDKAGYITPVPKGVGLMTRVSLLENVIEGAK